ncbi:hypothetical protein [Microbacterium sp. CGR1]|uniref:hypothetical protein n=1 Tax=Microbacterium sp. CGR1 TaxID=1696072 RepID=UPI003DA47810
MPIDSVTRRLNAQKAIHTRWHGELPPQLQAELDDNQRRILEERIAQLLEDGPTLTPEQAARIGTRLGLRASSGDAG